jgi:hypothetical protein
MKKLCDRKTRLNFTTGAELRYRGKMRAVIVEVDNPFAATVRLSGTRQRYPFSWHGLYYYAAEMFARSERDRRKAERAARRKERI